MSGCFHESLNTGLDSTLKISATECRDHMLLHYPCCQIIGDYPFKSETDFDPCGAFIWCYYDENTVMEIAVAKSPRIGNAE